MSYPSTGNGGGGAGMKQNQKNNNGIQNIAPKGVNGVNLGNNDLLKLLGVLEGELQAREVVIAVLKSERIKHLIYPAGPQLARPGPRNPLTQLWQDVLGAQDKSNSRVDINSIHNLQQVQAKLLENMISQNSELLMKIEERCCTDCMNCSGMQSNFSLEKIFNREAKDEAERVLENETKASLVLNQVREREKQIVLLLLNERQRLLQKLETTRTNCQELLRALREEKVRNSEMVDGLEEESKRSLQMEEQMEISGKQHSAQKRQFQTEITNLKDENARQAAEILRLRSELEKLSAASGGVRSQVVSSVAAAKTGTAPVCPAPTAQRNLAEDPSSSAPKNRPTPPPVPPNKPVILRKPAHLLSGATSPNPTTPVPAGDPKEPQRPSSLDSEIKNFQNVFVQMKTSPSQPNSPSAPAEPATSPRQ